MDKTTIINLLTNSGLKVFGMDSNFVYFEDPSCIFPAFDTFLEYAWLAILVFTAIMLFGWGVLYIKNGIKLDTLFNNAKTVLLVLCILGVVKPIVNIIYGKDLFAQQCEVKQVSMAAVNELLDARKKTLGKSDESLLYESFNMIDTGPLDLFDDGFFAQSETSEITFSNNKSVKTEESEVIYVKADGTKVKRTGGSRSWRNNNPGNIRLSKKATFAYSHGAIGESGGFAVFPDEETGLRAAMSLLRSKNYKSLQLRQVYHRWAPASDNNNPKSYANRVSSMSGISLNKRIQDLNDTELRKVVRAMQVVEDWREGTEQKL